MLDSIQTTIKSGSEHFCNDEKKLPIILKDFWGRGFSQLVTNNLRGILAEYIVASDIGITNKPREERDAYDLITPEGIKIEVKSASYIQSRSQKSFSNISFSIRPTQGYDILEKKYKDSKRQSDFYVFCLLSHKDQNTINPLNLDQREFMILPTNLLNNSQYKTQKTITLNRLNKLGLVKVKYGKIYETIKNLSDKPKSQK